MVRIAFYTVPFLFGGGSAMLAQGVLSGETLVPMGVGIAVLGVAIKIAWNAGQTYKAQTDALAQLKTAVEELKASLNARIDRLPCKQGEQQKYPVCAGAPVDTGSKS